MIPRALDEALEELAVNARKAKLFVVVDRLETIRANLREGGTGYERAAAELTERVGMLLDLPAEVLDAAAAARIIYRDAIRLLAVAAQQEAA